MTVLADEEVEDRDDMAVGDKTVPSIPAECI